MTSSQLVNILFNTWKDVVYVIQRWYFIGSGEECKANQIEPRFQQKILSDDGLYSDKIDNKHKALVKTNSWEPIMQLVKQAWIS